MDGRDIRGIQRRERLRFTLEAGDPLLVSEKFFRQDLDRYFPSKSRVTGLPYLAHPARAEWREDLVGAEASTRRQIHGRQRIIARAWAGRGLRALRSRAP